MSTEQYSLELEQEHPQFNGSLIVNDSDEVVICNDDGEDHAIEDDPELNP